jgi:hypothetical protein
MHGSMVPAAECHQVVHVRHSAIGPVRNVMDVCELRVAAAGEAAAFVPPVDLDALHRSRMSARSTLIQDRSVRVLNGKIHVGVTGEPPHNLDRHGTHTGDFGHGPTRTTDQQFQRRMHHDPRAP